jgi:hypothetical protein
MPVLKAVTPSGGLQRPPMFSGWINSRRTGWGACFSWKRRRGFKKGLVLLIPIFRTRHAAKPAACDGDIFEFDSFARTKYVVA